MDLPPYAYLIFFLLSPGVILQLIGIIIGTCIWMAVIVHGLKLGEWRPETTMGHWLQWLLILATTGFAAGGFYYELNLATFTRDIPWIFLAGLVSMSFAMPAWMGLFFRSLGIKRTDDR